MEKYEWDYIKQFHLNPPSVGDFKRSPNVENDYKNYRMCIENKKLSIDKVIFEKIFNSKTNLRWKLVPNEFPYYLDENIDHMLLWIYAHRLLVQRGSLKVPMHRDTFQRNPAKAGFP